MLRKLISKLTIMRRRFRNHLTLLPRQLRFLRQRFTRGWPDSDLWSLDMSLAKIIAPRLKRFKRNLHGHPAFMTKKEWDDLLDEMIWAFEWCAAGKQFSAPKSECERAAAAFEEFGKHYMHLWI